MEKVRLMQPVAEFVDELEQAGVPVGAVRLNGTVHDFLMLNALADTIPTKAALALAVISLQDVFDSGADNVLA